jgi:hypothetical protein
MKFKDTKDSLNRRHKSSLPDVDSHAVSNDDYFRTPDPPRKKMRSDWDTASLIDLDAGVQQETPPPYLNGR